MVKNSDRMKIEIDIGKFVKKLFAIIYLCCVVLMFLLGNLSMVFFPITIFEGWKGLVIGLGSLIATYMFIISDFSKVNGLTIKPYR